jgi:hypothetical protein
MASSTIHTARPVCLLFGPQSLAITESLFFIHDALQTTPSLNFLMPVLKELPSLWTVITSAWPALSQVPGAAQLNVLGRLGQGGPPSSPDLALNVLLTPVTVLRQIIEYWTAQEHIGEHHVVDAQGFCVGFLAAAAVSCSKGASDFRVVASAMIRLSVGIGAAVDLDALEHGPSQSIAIRWKGDSDDEKLKQLLLGFETVRTGGFLASPTVCHFPELTIVYIALHLMLYRYQFRYCHHYGYRIIRFYGAVDQSGFLG